MRKTIYKTCEKYYNSHKRRKEVINPFDRQIALRAYNPTGLCSLLFGNIRTYQPSLLNYRLFVSGGDFMNELTLFDEEKTTTVKEIANVLGVGESTVKRAIEKLRPLLGGVSSNSQGGYLLTEKQATLIKQEIQKHHNLGSRQIDSVTTELEENQTIANALMILQRRNTELKERAEVAENALNRIADGSGCFLMAQTAKALKGYGRNNLFEKLRDIGIFDKNNTPKQEQIDAGHFKVIVKFINEKVGNKPITLTTGKGLVYLAKKFNTEIDSSVKADA